MTRYIYIRECRHSQPVGCVAYTVDHDNDTISYGVSVIHPKAFPAEVTVKFNRDGQEQTKTAVKKVKDTFNRKTARAVAEERMKSNPTVVNVDDLVDNHWNNRIANLQEQLKNNPGHAHAKRIADTLSYLNMERSLIDQSNSCVVMAAISVNKDVPSRVSRVAKRWLQNQVDSEVEQLILDDMMEYELQEGDFELEEDQMFVNTDDLVDDRILN